MEKLAEELRATLKCFISLIYNCTEEQKISLQETNAELSRLMNNFKASFPHKEGLLVCPEGRKDFDKGNVLLPLHHNSLQEKTRKEKNRRSI